MTAREHHRALPRLAESLRRYKREQVRVLARRASEVASPRLRSALYDKLAKMRATPPAKFRDSYLNDRVRELELADLRDAVRSLGRTMSFVRAER